MPIASPNSGKVAPSRPSPRIRITGNNIKRPNIRKAKMLAKEIADFFSSVVNEDDFIHNPIA
ncbi:hypothetical protein GCM10011356_09350 [Kangiella profundi]|nr:hypothetical protein GCM10011356_09350 [Kangiella profundi]